jgi:hypothetical protein
MLIIIQISLLRGSGMLIMNKPRHPNKPPINRDTHIVVRINSEQVSEWSDEEIAQRWMKIFKGPSLMHQYLGNTDLSGAEHRTRYVIVFGVGVKWSRVNNKIVLNCIT